MSTNLPSEHEKQFIDDLARALLKTLGVINSTSPSNFRHKIQDLEEKNKSPPNEK